MKYARNAERGGKVAGSDEESCLMEEQNFSKDIH